MKDLKSMSSHQGFCNECGSEMYLDDVDYDFPGKQDEYWHCIQCETSCILEIRFNKPFREIWHTVNYGVKNKDYVIRCQSRSEVSSDD